jgi:hypothetical protein
VKPSSKKENVEKLDETHYTVAVHEPPLEGKANKAVERALAEYFDISRSSVEIVSGLTSKIKVVEIVI